jgi:hypothetical protein
MVHSSVTLYSSVLRNVTELYSSVPAPRNVVSIEELSLVKQRIYVAVYSSVNRRTYLSVFVSAPTPSLPVRHTVPLPHLKKIQSTAASAPYATPAPDCHSRRHRPRPHYQPDHTPPGRPQHSLHPARHRPRPSPLIGHRLADVAVSARRPAPPPPSPRLLRDATTRRPAIHAVPPPTPPADPTPTPGPALGCHRHLQFQSRLVIFRLF